MNKQSLRKLTTSGILIAIGVILSPLFVINLGVIKASPTQHLINVISAVLLGPWYAVANAFLISLIRNLIGTGSLLAFPGSMVGALLAGIFYLRFKQKWAAALGEVIGTGLLGALLSYPIATLILGSQKNAMFFIAVFSASTFLGAIIGYLMLCSLPLDRIVPHSEGDQP